MSCACVVVSETFFIRRRLFHFLSAICPYFGNSQKAQACGLACSDSNRDTRSQNSLHLRAKNNRTSVGVFSVTLWISSYFFPESYYICSYAITYVQAFNFANACSWLISCTLESSNYKNSSGVLMYARKCRSSIVVSMRVTLFYLLSGIWSINLIFRSKLDRSNPR
jgi:hypothetical protein